MYCKLRSSLQQKNESSCEACLLKTDNICLHFLHSDLLMRIESTLIAAISAKKLNYQRESLIMLRVSSECILLSLYMKLKCSNTCYVLNEFEL